MLVHDLRGVGFLHVFQPLDLVPEIGFGTDDLNILVILFHTPGKPHEGPTGSNTGNDTGHFATGLGNDLRARGMIMGLPIGIIVVLVGQKIPVRVFPGQAVSFLNGPVRPQMTGG